MMAWAMLIVDTFDAASDAQVKFYADAALKTSVNPMGKEFGTLYSALTDKAAVNKLLKAMVLKGKEEMKIPMVQEMLKACITGKGYAKNLGDFTKLMVNAKAIKDLGNVLMPFHADATAAQKDLDKLQEAYIKNLGAAGLTAKVDGKGPFSILEYLQKRQDKIAGDAVTKAVRKVIMDALGALPAVLPANLATNLATQKAAVATALKGWDKYATGVNGTRCEQVTPGVPDTKRTGSCIYN